MKGSIDVSAFGLLMLAMSCRSPAVVGTGTGGRSAVPGSGGADRAAATGGVGGSPGSDAGPTDGGPEARLDAAGENGGGGGGTGGGGGSIRGGGGGVIGNGSGGLGTGGAMGEAPPPCAGSAVRVTQTSTRFTMDNGLVQATVDTTDATLPSLVFNGIETMQTGGYFTFGTNVYTAGPFTGRLAADPATNGGSLAEVSMTTRWNGTTGVIPLDIEIRFALPRCSQGVYEYVVLTHPPAYPAFTPGEMRVNHYVNWDTLFDSFAVDDVRRGPFLSQADAASSQTVPGAPVEVRKYVSGPFANRPGWQKYDNSIEWGEGTVYGWTSTSRQIGLWLINPSNEYLPGGPMKTDLTLHDGGIGRGALLNYWGGTHFYGAFEAPQANQRREKVIGPWLLYVNRTATAGSAGRDALWADARQRLAWEKAVWPYGWELDPRYPARAARGTVEGQLTFEDPQQPAASAANAWVGLAGPPLGGLPNFEHQGWDYQYWRHADAAGHFSLANVRPGSYTLHAFAPGIHGIYMGAANSVSVAAGQTVGVGVVKWMPDRRGPTVWEIGIPDRTPREFFRGDQAWHYGTHLLFGNDFPSGINYTVGTSMPARDWNYLQPGGSWNVRFNVASVPTGVAAVSLVLDVAGTDGATAQVSVNGTSVGSATFPYDDGSIDRDQPHGAWQTGRITVPLAQVRTGANTLTLASSGRIMWDYLRLEWVVP